MASLFITKDDVLLFKTRLHDAVVTIGRAPENTIRLGDLSVSRQHARLRRDEQGKYLVEEVRSTNGIFLNENKLAAPTRLQEGDEIKVGAYVLRFAEELAATTDRLQALFAPSENTFIRKPEESTATGVLVNEANNAIFNLTQDRIVFGNEGEVDIRVPSAAPLRASIFRRGDLFYICSETGAPCVRVNGILIMNAQLQYNDVIEIGGRRFTLRDI